MYRPRVRVPQSVAAITEPAAGRRRGPDVGARGYAAVEGSGDTRVNAALHCSVASSLFPPGRVGHQGACLSNCATNGCKASQPAFPHTPEAQRQAQRAPALTPTQLQGLDSVAAGAGMECQGRP